MSNKLCFDINTSINTSNGLTLKELGAILQNFTSKFLYIKNEKLCGVDKVTDLQPDHRLICYDDGFQMLCSDMRTTVYCFRKELADHLNRPAGFRGYTFGYDRLGRGVLNQDPVIDPLLSPVRIPPAKPPKPDIFLNKILGDLKRPDPRSEYECHLKSLISDTDALTRLGVKPPTASEAGPESINLSDPSIADMAERFGTSGASTKEMETNETDKVVNITAETNEMGKRFRSNLNRVSIPGRMQPSHKSNQRTNHPTNHPNITSDVAAQSRKNGTMALIAALRRKREEKAALVSDDEVREPSPKRLKVPIQLPCIPLSAPLVDDKGKEEECSWSEDDSWTDTKVETATPPPNEDKVCSVIANILRSKATKNSGAVTLPPVSEPIPTLSKYKPLALSDEGESSDEVKEEDKEIKDQDKEISVEEDKEIKDQEEVSDSGEEDSDSDDVFGLPVSEILPMLPFVPRNTAHNVHLSSLSVPLQKAVIKTVLEMKDNVLPVGTIYFNGATLAVLVDRDNLVSVYDWDNLINADRLDPNRFNGEYDGTPGSLPIAQFTVHQYPYRLYLEPKESPDVSEPVRHDLPRGRIDDSMLIALFDVCGTDDESICSIVPDMFDGKKCMIVAKTDVTKDDKIEMVVTVLRSRDCDLEPESFWVNHISDNFTIIYRRSDPDAPGTPPPKQELSDDSIDRYMSEATEATEESSSWSSNSEEGSNDSDDDTTDEKDSEKEPTPEKDSAPEKESTPE